MDEPYASLPTDLDNAPYGAVLRTRPEHRTDTPRSRQTTGHGRLEPLTRARRGGVWPRDAKVELAQLVHQLGHELGAPMWFITGENEQKAKNLSANPRCALTAGTDTLTGEARFAERMAA